MGWTLVLNPDGTTTAWNPDRTKVLHSHSPPARTGNPPGIAIAIALAARSRNTDPLQPGSKSRALGYLIAVTCGISTQGKQICALRNVCRV